jgi:hypothetical protein
MDDFERVLKGGDYATSPLKAIRQKCRDCSGGSASEARQCNVIDCDLWPYRFGKNPFRKKREMTEEQRKAAVERLAKARADRANSDEE